MLNAKDASADKQSAALKVWLKANPPSPSLRLSLLANGYGHVLDEAVGRMPRDAHQWRKHSA